LLIKVNKMKKALIFYGLLLSAGLFQEVNADSWQNLFNEYFNRSSFDSTLKHGKEVFNATAKTIKQYLYKNQKTSAGLGIAGLGLSSYYALSRYQKKHLELIKYEAKK